jgi:hypothetical protein
MGFFSFIVLLAIAYLIWRVTDQLPDLIFRLSEIQRDVAEIRRRVSEPAGEAVSKPVGEPVGKPVGEPVGEPVGKPVNDPGAASQSAGSGNATLGQESGADYTGR